MSVIPLQKGILKEELTYFTAQEISLGDVVSIRVRSKKILGLVVSIEDVADTKSSIKDMHFNLKKIDEIKEQSIFRKEFIESAYLSSKYFVSRKNLGITALIPVVLKEEYDKVANLSLLPLLRGEGEGEVKIKSEKLLFQASLEERISFYKTLIRESFAKKKSLFLVLPTERDIAIFSELLSKGIENFIISIHGNQNPKKQFENIKKIITSSHPILVLGTAVFLAIPRQDFEIIIVEHESSGAYRMIAPPHFDLRIFTEIYSSKTNAKFILADSLMTFETIARKEIDNFGEIRPLSFKINFKGKIEIPEKESASSMDKEKFKILKENTIKEIKNAIEKKENVFIFSLRKGLATITVCRDCGQEVLCEKCLAPLVLYLSRDGKKRMFVCNRCKKEASAETRCANCGSWNLYPLGIGTDTVFLEVTKQFGNIGVFKFDKRTIKTTREAEKIIKEFSAENIATGKILVGTEMAFNYLKDKLPLSIIASFDSLWSIPSYKISEKVIQIILSIVAKTEKKLIIQTKNEKDPAIIAITTESLLSFVREELEDRQKLGYPPYKRFIKITYLGDQEETTKVKRDLAEVFKEYDPVIFSGFVAKLKDKYTTNVLLKIDPQRWSLPELSQNSIIDQNLFEKLSSLPPSFSVNVDPEDLL